jgi:sodium transport system permease protein
MNTFLTVFRKEMIDALRDRRAWMVTLILSVLSGPVVLLILSNFIAGLEEKAAAREVLFVAPERAPTLINFLQRQGANIKTAPADYSAQLRSGQLQNAVFVPAADFEATLARGETVTLDVYYDESHNKAQAVVRTGVRLVQSFNRELGAQRLIARGISPAVLNAVNLEEKDLAPSRSRGAQLLFVIPWTALIVAVYGAFAVAIDVTAGERERGSLEPLLVNPLHTMQLVLGKWAVATVNGIAVVILTLFGYLVAMRFVSGETLSALMQLQWREVTIFAAVLMPFAALMAAANMLAATYARTYKEAQTYVSYIVMAVQFAAIVPVFLTVRDALWQLAVPSVGQLTVLMKALRGETIGAQELLIPFAVCAIGAAVLLWLQARLLRNETIVFARS